MLYDLTRLYRDRLADLCELDGSGVLTHLAALVRPETIEFAKDEKRRVPVPVDGVWYRPASETPGALDGLVPDETKRAIAYFEGGAAEPQPGATRAANETFRLLRLPAALHVWYNPELFAPSPTLQSRLVALLLRKLCGELPAPAPLGNLTTRFVRVREADGKQFAGYDYSGERGRYLTAPYAFFVLELEAQFVLADCPPPPVAVPPETC